MHNLTKIRLFRLLLKLSWLPAWLFLYPLACMRKKLEAQEVFFFDRFSMGGAQRVHIDILHSIAGQPKQVFFTRRSPDTGMKAAFEAVPHTRCRDLHFFCDNLLLRLFAVHYWAFFLNRHHGLKILSSNSTFFYDLLPWLHPDNTRIELLHNFSYGKKGMEFFGLANYRFLDLRLVVDAYTADNIRRQYADAGIPEPYLARVRIIEPGVEVPTQPPTKDAAPLRVLYAGRGGAQKRVWLIDRIARACYAQNLPLEFHFAGNAGEELSPFVRERAVLHGRISDPQAMQALYARCHVLLLTSAYEGFPMFIKEGMAQGCVPLVTGLPGNKTHLRQEANALLMEPVEDEEEVVRQGIAYLQVLCTQELQRQRLAAAAYDYARAHFSKSVFSAAYQELLLNP